MDENPYASPQEEVTLADPPEVPQAEEGQPPLSVIVAWCTGFVLVPLSLTISFALGLVSVFLLLPITGIVAMMLVRRPWVWRAAMFYFPLYVGFTLLAGQLSAHSRFLMMTYLFLPASALGAMVCVCLVTQSARDYYYRTQARQSV